MSIAKVLKYDNRKTEIRLYDISTPEKEAAAYLRLFKELDEYWGCYSDLEEVEPELCDSCKDGQHKYCQGKSLTLCTCVETKECKELNWRRRSQSLGSKLQRELYGKAKAGDVNAIKRLMTARRNNEYESVWKVDVIDPLVPDEEEICDA